MGLVEQAGIGVATRFSVGRRGVCGGRVRGVRRVGRWPRPGCSPSGSRAVRCWLSTTLLATLVASVLVVAPGGAGAATNDQPGLLGSSGAAPPVRAGSRAQPADLRPGPAPVSAALSESGEGSGSVAVIHADETGAPALSSAVVDGSSVVLTYNEVLDVASVPAAGDFSASVTDSETATASAPAVTAVSVSVSEVTLTLSAAVRSADIVLLDYTPGVAPIRGAAGNDVAGFEHRIAANLTAAATDAALSGLELSGVVLSPGFAPAVTAYSASVDHSVLSVTVTAMPGDSRATVVVVPVDADSVTAGDQVLLAVGPNVVTVIVIAEDGATVAVYTVTVTRVGEVGAPALSSAVVDGSSVVLAYNEVLHVASRPAAGDFSVSVTDLAAGAVSARAVTAVSVSAGEVTLTLSAAVRSADKVTLDYAPGRAAIRDAARNDAAGLAGHLVTNLTIAAMDAALSALELSGGLSGVGLSPGFAPGVTAYSASVGHSVSSLTVTATPSDARASVVVAPGDADSVTAGDQVSLRVGSNTVTVTATAEDGATTGVYTLSVVRAEGPVVDPGGGIDWQRFGRGVPEGRDATEAKGWLLTTLEYALNEWWNDYKNFDEQDSGAYLDFVGASNAGSSSQQRYRDSASMALALAVALQTGVYDAGVTGVSRDVALARASRLVGSVAHGHHANVATGRGGDAWGVERQSALWAGDVGLAGWLLWDDLSETDKTLVTEMILAEANEYRNPLSYRDRSGVVRFSGGSKSEEQAWNAYVLSLAAVMMPDHRDVDTWKTSSIHLMLSAYARPEDVSSADVYHGHPLRVWLNGSNINNDGTVPNHGVVHPDYMASATVEFNAALIYSLADLPTPEAARFNVDRVTEALAELESSAGSRSYSPQFAAKSWLTYWLQHQNASTPVVYENEPYELEFARTASIEAEDPANTVAGNARRRQCSHCSHNGGVELLGSGAANAVTIANINTPTSGRYRLHIVYYSEQDRDIQLTLEGEGPYSAAQYVVRLAGLGRDRVGVADTRVYLNAGDNDVTIAKLDHSGTNVPIIDRIILGAPDALPAPWPLTLAEDSAADLTVRLLPRPSGDVTVTVTVTGEGLSVSPPTLTFAPANWDVDQTVQVLAAADVIDTGDGSGTVTLSYSWGGSDPVHAVVPVRLANDGVFTLVVPETLTVVKGSAQDLPVGLSAQPSGDVTVTAAASGRGLLAVPPTLTFTPANWDVAQTVWVFAAADAASGTVTLSYQHERLRRPEQGHSHRHRRGHRRRARPRRRRLGLGRRHGHGEPS